WVCADVIGKVIQEDSIRDLGDTMPSQVVPRKGLPTAGSFTKDDLILVLGPFDSSDTAFQLGGAIRLAVESGATAVVAYPVRPDASTKELLSRLVGERLIIREVSSGFPVSAQQKSFSRYTTAYAKSATYFEGLPETGEVLATAKPLGDESLPVGFRLPLGRG